MNSHPDYQVTVTFFPPIPFKPGIAYFQEIIQQNEDPLGLISWVEVWYITNVVESRQCDYTPGFASFNLWMFRTSSIGREDTWYLQIFRDYRPYALWTPQERGSFIPLFDYSNLLCGAVRVTPSSPRINSFFDNWSPPKTNKHKQRLPWDKNGKTNRIYTWMTGRKNDPLTLPWYYRDLIVAKFGLAELERLQTQGTIKFLTCSPEIQGWGGNQLSSKKHDHDIIEGEIVQ